MMGATAPLRNWFIDRRVAIPPCGLTWLAAALLLLAIGLATVYSASFYRALLLDAAETHFFRRQLLGAGLGLTALALASRVDPRRWIDLAPAAYGLTILFLLLVWSPLGDPKGGAHRWVDLGLIGLQSSELAKLSVPLLIAWYLTRYGDLGGRQTRGKVHVNLLMIGALLLVVALVLVQPDLGTAVFILTVGLLVLLCAGVPLLYPIGLGLLSSPVLVWQITERWSMIRTRLLGMTDPEKVDQVRHALTAIRAGGIDGVGVGLGTEKTLFLFAEFSDFVFAVYAEEVGLIGITVLLALFVTLLLTGWRVVSRTSDLALRILGLAIVLNLVLQAIINLAVNTALAPTKGIALPFISHGSTGLSIALFEVGILLAISRVGIQPGRSTGPSGGSS